jgi:hypothetical protein
MNLVPRKAARRLAFGLATVTGLAQRGYFIPSRQAPAAGEPGTRPPYAALERLFTARETEYRAAIAEIERASAMLAAIGKEPPPEPRWDQGWFPPLDAAAAYVMVRRLAPQRIVEVGAGHSTRFLVRAARDAGLSTRMIAIDPAPRVALDGLGVELVRATMQEVDLSVFAALAPGDVLFVDSSHILMPGSDVDHIINRVWPMLPRRVVVHFHDVFLPDDYPASWAWRGYNEQLAVAAMLSSGGAEIEFASHYVATRMRDAIKDTIVARVPRLEGAPESSIWLRKVSAKLGGSGGS